MQTSSGSGFVTKLNASGTALFMLATTSTDGVDFYSREASDANKKPRLAVTFSP